LKSISEYYFITKLSFMSLRRERLSFPSIRDVAEHVGVSPATVSRVLNDYPYISADVRDRVLDAVVSLGYKRNRVAQRLRASRSLVIGILVSDITNPFLNTIVASVEAAFFERGYSVLMSNTGGNPRKEIDYLTMMENEEAAGLVIVPTVEDVSRITELAADGMPIVVVDRRMPHARVDCVLSDNVGGARSAVEHLISLGNSQIGHIGGPLHLTSGRERLQGYLDAMQSAKLPVNQDWIRIGNHQYESGYQNTLALLDSRPELTALFCENNMMSLGALTALRDRSIPVPDQMSIVGFDDTPWAALLKPSLTVVAQSTAQIGERAAALLLERMEQPTLDARTEVLPTTLIVRESGGAPP
jgi:LacI family transcriptional regulator, galactose operon repressor